ncbi:MAG: 4Fe-4S dicluster domain-containing protein [Solobacterium sp.]|nr:4Fe-4S dicluster domain-containing protein [Solobacterium sp.]MBQ6531652.1 4Fe-4S dicluster domain-containing protein [Solobacterium sp.]MBR0214804.1 4Fe-4S dicluster domain-containing protein [Solobacterium sp.]
MTLKLELDLAKCCACGACAIACMDQNDIDLSTGVRPFRTVFRQENRRTGEIAYYSMSCMHCDNAPCVTACPSGCLYKDTETGLTLYDNTYCIGCHSCAMACPFGAPTFGPDNKMRKCDGCINRIRAGLLPACVKGCTFDALKLVHTEDEQLPFERSLVAQCAVLSESQK